MTISQAEENKHKIISWSISLGIFALLLLFFIFFIIVTPNPPFPETLEGGGGDGIVEFNIGNLIEGTGNVDPSNGIGEAVKVVESTEVTTPTPQNNSEEFITSDNGENSDIKKNDSKTNAPVVVVPPKPKTAAEKIREAAMKNQGKNGGGDGNSGQAGDEGRPDGKPNVHGNGGQGGDGGNGGGDGGGDGPGKGPNRGPGVSFTLGNRKIMVPPPVSKDTQEEGTVVVEITVDKNGNVTKAEATGRGTNTNSAILKTKARQAALATKFNVSGEFEEQKGTITIVFKF